MKTVERRTSEAEDVAEEEAEEETEEATTKTKEEAEAGTEAHSQLWGVKSFVCTTHEQEPVFMKLTPERGANKYVNSIPPTISRQELDQK